MSILRRSIPEHPFVLDKKERVLAWSPARTPEGPLEVAATSRGLRLSSPDLVIPWHTIATAQWEEPKLTVIANPEGRSIKVVLEIEQAKRFVPVVRDRVTDTVIASERRMITEDQGATFVARRQPDSTIAWSVVFDSGLDPHNPQTRAQADALLTELRGSLGV